MRTWQRTALGRQALHPIAVLAQEVPCAARSDTTSLPTVVARAMQSEADMRALVTWGSKHGGTAGIGQIVAHALQTRGIEVVAAPVDDVAYDSRWNARRTKPGAFARANTPGIFAAAPAKAEEMYAPETYGRSNAESVAID
jgi:hypothetical protein